MQDLNHVILIGRLTRTVGEDERSFGYISNGQAKAELNIAVNTTKKVNNEWKDEANYFNVTVWGKQAENLQSYLIKGQQVCIDGHLKLNKWEKDGQKHYDTIIVADHVQLLAKPSGNGSSQRQPHPQTQSQQAPAPAEEDGDSFPEDIPF